MLNVSEGKVRVKRLSDCGGIGAFRAEAKNLVKSFKVCIVGPNALSQPAVTLLNFHF